MTHGARIGTAFLECLLVAASLGRAPADAAALFAPAKSMGKAGCPAGTFLDVGRGDCWSCPAGYNRTVFAVTANNACERPAHEAFGGATRHGRGTGLLLRTDCPSGQFWDPNGYCYSCPRGYNRTALAVTSPKACSQAVKAAYASATKSRDFCPTGAFLDIGRGECWSCPANWYRTVNPVTDAKACASSADGILAGNSAATCTYVITALREGEKGVTRLTQELEKAVAPVMKPVNDGIRKLSAQLRTPAQWDQMLDELAKGLRPYDSVMDEVQRISSQLNKTGDQLHDLLLDPKAMCEEDTARLSRRLTDLGLLRPGAASGQTPKHFYFAAVFSGALVTPGSPSKTFALTLVSDGSAPNTGLFFSMGLGTSTAVTLKGVELSFGSLLFPYVSYDDFGNVSDGPLSMELGLHQSDKLKEFLSKLMAGRAGGFLIPDGISISFDPVFWTRKGGQAGWGIGVSKNLMGGTQAPTDSFRAFVGEGTVDFTFKLRGR